MHIRTKIRNLVRDRLIAAAIVGDRVYASRHRPVNKDVFPSILVWADLDAAGKSDTNDDNFGDIDQAVAPRKRNLITVLSVGIDAGTTDELTIDDTLDGLTEEVERVMVGDGLTDFGLKSEVVANDASQFVYEVTYIRTELKEFPGGERIVLSALMYYDIQYRGQV